MQVVQTAPEPAEVVFREIARLTGGLTAPSRLRLLDRLCQGEQTVEQLARSANLSISNASRQLRMLAECRLISARREPPRVYYRIADDAVLRFWFALRALARERLVEIDRAVDAFLSATDPATPIGRDELLSRMATGEVVLIDVRPVSEYEAGHIPEAVSIPLEELTRRLPELPPGRTVVAYCRGPFCMLAAEAVRMLRAHGWTALRLEDGLPEWRAARLPVRVA